VGIRLIASKPCLLAQGPAEFDAGRILGDRIYQALVGLPMGPVSRRFPRWIGWRGGISGKDWQRVAETKQPARPMRQAFSINRFWIFSSRAGSRRG